MTSSFSLAGLVAVGSFFTAFAALMALRSWRVSLHAPAEIAPSVIVEPRPYAGWVDVLARAVSPRDPRRRDENDLLLLQAGWGGGGAVPVYLALRAILAVALPVSVWLIRPPVGTLEALFSTLLPVGVGLYLPKWIVSWQRSARQQRLARMVPNMLDLLVSCVEAGLGVDAALRHVAKDIGVASPELADELHLLNTQVTAGMSRIDALHALERRTGVDDLAALVNVLGVVERFGSGIAESLRAHAQLSRRRRALDAETRGARASPKLTVVMILFILPPLFVVLIGSALLNVESVL